MKTRLYLCIDLKTFYASVECVERGLDPYKTKLVVADASKGKGAICLAISPLLKEMGIRNRCRLFEIPNNIEYIAALPRMKLYIKYSADIYGIYLKYFAKEDIYVYSIDECFIDITQYLAMYRLNSRQLASKVLKDIYETTGITATVGIGTNLFLAKVALDIMAKHDKSHMGYLSEELFKEKLWHHRPLTDFWNIGRGIEKRLAKHGIYDLYGVAYADEKILYKEFGVNAEFLIDHSKGIEPCTIEEIHNYVPDNNSLSHGQILPENYNYEDAFLAFKEMIELGVLDLVDKHLVTNHISLMVGYASDLTSPSGGSMKLDGYTNSHAKLKEQFINLFYKTKKKNYLIRRLNIGFGSVKDESYRTIDLFYDEEKEEKERKIQETILKIKKKYGKNSILKAMNLEEKATTRKRNKLIGGHNGE